MITKAEKRVLLPARSLWKPVLIATLLALLVLFAFGLRRDASFMPSARIGRLLPDFSLAALDGDATIKSASIVGTPHIINFWASWCGACREEHAVLVGLGERFAKDPSVRMLGINYRDTRANAGQFLKKMGAFPYPSALDPDARTGVDFGVFGLPETFFVDAGGIVRARHIGPLTPAAAETYLALIGAGR